MESMTPDVHPTSQDHTNPIFYKQKNLLFVSGGILVVLISLFSLKTFFPAVKQPARPSAVVTPSPIPFIAPKPAVLQEVHHGTVVRSTDPQCPDMLYLVNKDTNESVKLAWADDSGEKLYSDLWITDTRYIGKFVEVIAQYSTDAPSPGRGGIGCWIPEYFISVKKISELSPNATGRGTLEAWVCPPYDGGNRICDNPLVDYEIILYHADTKQEAASAKSDRSGKLSISLPRGDYYYIVWKRPVDGDILDFFSIGAGETTQSIFNIEIPTSIPPPDPSTESHVQDITSQ